MSLPRVLFVISVISLLSFIVLDVATIVSISKTANEGDFNSKELKIKLLTVVTVFMFLFTCTVVHGYMSEEKTEKTVAGTWEYTGENKDYYGIKVTIIDVGDDGYYGVVSDKKSSFFSCDVEIGTPLIYNFAKKEDHWTVTYVTRISGDPYVSKKCVLYYRDDSDTIDIYGSPLISQHLSRVAD